MESCFGLIAIFLILDVSFVCTTGNTNLEINQREGFHNQSGTYAPQSVKRRHIAQVSNIPRSTIYLYGSRTTDIPDFVFPEFQILPSRIEEKVDTRSFNQSTAQVTPEQVTPESAVPICRQQLHFDPIKRSFVFPIVPKVKFSRALTNKEIISIHIQQLKKKSKQKCYEYAKEVQNNTGISCLEIVPPENAAYVTHGIETEINEFPHMVALGKYNSDDIFVLICGGVLISHSYVLSAAHCTHQSNGIPSHAKLGFHKLSDKQSGVIIAIKNMIRHPDYKIPFMYADIALIELARSVTFTASIRPACLYQQYYTVPTIAWISGWGATEFAGGHSDALLKARLNVMDNQECANAYNNVREVPNGITSKMLCAGDSHGNWSRDTCQGDSGGPLQIPDPIYNCLFQVVGITSFGLSCALTPGVYTKVPSYVHWIENIVWP